MQRPILRWSIVVLLVLGAFFVMLPWLGCLATSRPGLVAFPNLSVTWGMCTYQIIPPAPGTQAVSIPGFTGPYWANVILGLLYLVAGAYLAITKRPL